MLPTLVLLLMLAFHGSARADTTARVLTVGIVPQQSATKLARTWGPVLRYLGEKTGYYLAFKTAPDIPVFEQRIASRRYDISYMNPYHYVEYSQNPGYTAFAKQSGKKIIGIMVTRRDAPYKDLRSLAGQPLAFPAPAAFAASILPRAALTREGVGFSAHYVKSHDSVYRAVAKGLYAAGGGIERTLNTIDPAIRKQLRILWRSKAYTPHAFAARPGLDPAIVHKLQQAMVAMKDDPRGRALLKAINFTGISPAKDSDWNDVRALDIHLIEHHK